MPYIPKPRRRSILDDGDCPANGGELNFVITTVIDEYMKAHGISYTRIADVLSALEGAKQEFYRRVAAPYEDSKIIQNGDVYTCHATILPGR